MIIVSRPNETLAGKFKRTFQHVPALRTIRWHDTPKALSIQAGNDQWERSETQRTIIERARREMGRCEGGCGATRRQRATRNLRGAPTQCPRLTPRAHLDIANHSSDEKIDARITVPQTKLGSTSRYDSCKRLYSRAPARSTHRFIPRRLASHKQRARARHERRTAPLQPYWRPHLLKATRSMAVWKAAKNA